MSPHAVSAILAAVSMTMAVIAVILCFTVEARRRKYILSECRAIREDLERLKASLKDVLDDSKES